MIRRTFILVLAILFIFLSGRGVFALSSTDQQRIDNDTEYYNSTQASACGSSQAAAITAGSGSPSGAAFPNLNPASMTNAINTWITQQDQQTGKTSELAGLGANIVADGKNSNISPFLIVSIAREESVLSSSTDYNVVNAGNSFGREAAVGQPTFQGANTWYQWTATPTESAVAASIDPNAQQNIGAVGGGDQATYLRNRFASQIDSQSLLALMEAYDGPSPTAPGAVQNQVQYTDNVDSWINELVDLTTSGSDAAANPSAGSTPSSAACSCTSAGSSAPTTTQSLIDFTDAEAAAQAATGIQVGLSVSDSSGKIINSYNGDMTVYGASITKAMLLVAYLNQDGSQTPTGAEDTQLTAMIEQSDNTAANATYKQVGAAAINKVASDAGMTNFSLDTSDPVYVLGQSLVTANDQARFFAMINSLIPASQLSYAQNLLSNISSTDTWGILSAKLPATIYSKAGWKQEPPSNNWVVNQAAQVVPTGQPASTGVGVAMVTSGSISQVAGEQLLQGVFTKLFSTLSPQTSCGGGSIVQTALSLAWPTTFSSPTTARPSASSPTPAYVAAMKQYNPLEYTTTDGTGGDCGVFVATVMRASGADPNYPQGYTVNQAEYVISHPNLYKVIYPATSTAQLQPGDILIINSGTTQNADGTINVGQGGGGAGGHTFIYVGPQAGGYSEAQASYSQPYSDSQSGTLEFTQLTDPLNRGSYLIARLIQ